MHPQPHTQKSKSKRDIFVQNKEGQSQQTMTTCLTIAMDCPSVTHAPIQTGEKDWYSIGNDDIMGCVWTVADEGGMLSVTGECPRFEGHAE